MASLNRAVVAQDSGGIGVRTHVAKQFQKVYGDVVAKDHVKIAIRIAVVEIERSVRRKILEQKQLDCTFAERVRERSLDAVTAGTPQVRFDQSAARVSQRPDVGNRPSCQNRNYVPFLL